MSASSSLKRKILADLPPCEVDPARVPEFVKAFGSAVNEATDTAALLVGSLLPADLAAAVERMARIVMDAIGTAGEQLDVAGHLWIAQAQRWAVEAFFARFDEVRVTSAQGGWA